MQDAIRFINVSKMIKTPAGSQKILQDISGTIPKGSILTLVGPSGSGKSTLLSLCNLLQSPDHGEIYVYNKEIRAWSVQELRRTVGMVMQTPTLIPGTVLDNLLLPAKLHGFQLNNPEYFITAVGLQEDILQKSVTELSGGQKQRVALARALVNRPSILLLDEVTSALDPTSVREVEDLLIKINRERETTLLWITHNLGQAQRVGDLTWLLVNGYLVEARDTKSFFLEPQEFLTKRFLSGGEEGMT